jgi:hypothetical protein
MLPLDHKRTTSTLAPPIFYVEKNWHIKDRRFPFEIAHLAGQLHMIDKLDGLLLLYIISKD